MTINQRKICEKVTKEGRRKRDKKNKKT